MAAALVVDSVPEFLLTGEDADEDDFIDPCGADSSCAGDLPPSGTMTPCDEGEEDPLPPLHQLLSQLSGGADRELNST